MKKLSILAILLFTVFASFSQNDSSAPIVKLKKFNAKVNTMNNEVIKGRIYAVNDSQMVLIRSSGGLYQIPAENIHSFTLKRKNSVLRGTLTGLGIGAITGLAIGLISGNDDPAEIWFSLTAGEKAIAGGIMLGASGAVIGAIAGAVAKKTFIIGGKQKKFHDLQYAIMMKLVQK